MDPVQQDIRNVQERIVRYEQKLAVAEQAGSKEEEKSLVDLLRSLQEKENILLRSQAPSKPCLQLVHTGLPVLCCTVFSTNQTLYLSWVLLADCSSGLT